MFSHDIYSATWFEEIFLPFNNLSRSIINDIVNLTEFTNLELYGNKLSGKLLVNIGKVSKLKASRHSYELHNSFSALIFYKLHLPHKIEPMVRLFWEAKAITWGYCIRQQQEPWVRFKSKNDFGYIRRPYQGWLQECWHEL
jgi:hypothetical protein